MNVENTLQKSRDMFKAKRVYGDPIEQDGVTVVPAAEIRGGGGGGGSDDGNGHSDGGGGFGISARPVGAWVVQDGRADWKPVIDVGRLMVGVIALLSLAAWWTRRSE